MNNIKFAFKQLRSWIRSLWAPTEPIEIIYDDVFDAFMLSDDYWLEEEEEEE